MALESDDEETKTLAEELEERLDEALAGEIANVEDIKDAFRSS